MPRCFDLYIMDRSKVCLYHRDWVSTGADALQKENHFKTLYGLCFQMKLFATAADPTQPTGTGPGHKPDGMRPMRIGEGTGFRSIRTNTYQLNFYELPSGIKLVLNTSPDVGNVRPLMEALYQELYVAAASRDPLYEPGAPIDSPAFDALLDEFLRREQLL